MADPILQPTLRVSKIYLLRQRAKAKSDVQIPKFNPLIVHLSSALQSQRKASLNNQMRLFTRKLLSEHHSSSFLLTERPHTHQEIRPFPHTQRNAYTSNAFRSRKKEDSHSFHISQIAEDGWNQKMRNNQKKKQEEVQRKEESKSKKKNYNMRKVQFKTFLKGREEQKVESTEQEPKQVVYEWQELNKWGASQKIESDGKGTMNNPHLFQRFSRDVIWNGKNRK